MTAHRSLTRGRRGFALPAVILLVAVLTILLTAGLSRVRADRQIAEAAEATADAFSLAQSGLQNYMGSRTVRPPDGDSVRINLTGGYANVIAHLVQNPADTMRGALFLVRATGVVINPLAGPDPQGRRTVAQFAQWQAGFIERRGALTAANNTILRSFYDSVVVSGIDACGQEATIPGIRTPNVGGPPQPLMYGDPPLLDWETGSTIAAGTKIDWAAIEAGALIPDYTTVQYGDTTFPVVYVNSASGYTLSTAYPDSSTGLLVVRGTLNVSSPFRFRGVIITGGKAVFSGVNIRIQGMVITGLGGGGGSTEMGGTAGLDFFLTFNSCDVNRALAPLRGLIPVGNAWMDAWAEY